MKYIHQYIFTLLSIGVLFNSSCGRFVEPPESKNQIERNIVFGDSAIATSALLNIYFTLGTSVYINTKNMSLYADEYTYTSALTALMEYNQSRLLKDNFKNAAFWGSLYSVIYQCNSIVEGTEQSANLSERAKKQLSGEAKFLRAFANFYLINFYDHIPLVLTTSVDRNARAFQSPAQEVYAQIVKDLQQAKTDLKSGDPEQEKVRANHWTAVALLARVYLFQENWDDAEKEATKVINAGRYSPLPRLEDVFKANSKESILQFWNQKGAVGDATELIPASSGLLPEYLITTQLYDAFEQTDGRKIEWISSVNVTINGGAGTYYYPAKYKNREPNAARPEYVMALRLSEQYLIRAEARAWQNKTEDAVADLNVIRDRATGLTPIENTVGKQECLDAIARERKREFFGEWANRFLDLKRTEKLDVVIGPLKPTWKLETSKALPIPNKETIYNSNLIQNYGY